MVINNPMNNSNSSHHRCPTPTSSFHRVTGMSCEYDDDESKRAATAYLSNWFNNNSFHIDEGGSKSVATGRGDGGPNPNDNYDGNVDKSGDDVSCSSSISSMSLSVIDAGEEDEGGHLKKRSNTGLRSSSVPLSRQEISVGFSLSGNDLDIYEDEDEHNDFDASNGNGNAINNARNFDESRRRSQSFSGPSCSFYDQKQTQDSGKMQDWHRSDSVEYLPSVLKGMSNLNKRQDDTQQQRQRPKLEPKHRANSTRTCTSTSKSKPATPINFSSNNGNGHITSRLPWRDHRGVTGEYTGRVNDRMQPHGSGALIYQDGSAQTSIWVDGRPVEFWSPEKKMPDVDVKMKSKDKKKKKLKVDHHKQQQEKAETSFMSESDAGNTISTYLPHLDLGDVGNSQDMLTSRTSKKGANMLQLHNFAFILRSNGQWTYAIVADRQEDSIRFVVDATGSAKVLSRKNWSKYIRLVDPKAPSSKPVKKCIDRNRRGHGRHKSLS